MLKKDDFTYFGKFLKPHGTKGEIGLLGDSFTLGDECDFVAADIDGILVPFFFEYKKSKNSDTLIVKIERMESAEAVRLLTNREAYIPREWVEESDNYSWSYFRGFKAEDKSRGTIGTIIDVDDSTINTLFVVEQSGEEILIPAQEEFIANIDHKKRQIIFDLPEGLI
ncbi:MAG: 16S rRNA processing protein RimM [Bacteroidaceae bacterium]|nr:16S rRNA processing protein RimM [Bacteroidaceae bacterium]MBR3855169.1 16S rRNA processing protein RimM [Bacteroidaceae bacterium]